MSNLIFSKHLPQRDESFSHIPDSIKLAQLHPFYKEVLEKLSREEDILSSIPPRRSAP